ncbi:MAG: carbamoyltransferase, partial [Nitrospirae bacterium]
MKILGINDGHNAAACLYEDGLLTAAIQEERLRRVKNWAGMPTEAIQTVLNLRGYSLNEIDFVAMNGRYAAYPMTREQLMEAYRRTNDVGATVRRTLRRKFNQLVKWTPIEAA